MEIIPLFLVLVLGMLVNGAFVQRRYCERKLDLAFVIDTSVSISARDFKLQMQFVNDIVNFLDVRTDHTRIAAVSYSNHVFPQFKFNDYRTKQEVLQAVSRIPDSMGDATRTYLALEYTNDDIFATGNGERPDVIDVVVVLTDGGTNPGSYDSHSGESGKRQTLIEAAKIKARPAYIFAIGVGSAVTVDELNGISSDPDKRFTIQVSSFRQLNTENVKQMLLDRACITIEPTPPPAPPSALPVTCERKLDLAFVIDTSASISARDFKLQMQFVNDIINFLDVSTDHTHVAAVSYSNHVFPQFKFNDYRTKQGVLQAVSRIPDSMGDATRTYLALKHTNDEIFATGNGERPDVIDVVVVLTDGATNPGSYDKHWGESGKRQTLIEAAKIKARPAYIFSIGVGSAVTVDELNGISSDPDKRFTIQVSSFQELNKGEIKQMLLDRACSSCKGAEADIIFVSDSSGSIGSKGYDDLKNFAKSVVQRIDKEENDVQVGFITFSDNARFEFKLNTYTDGDDIIKAVDRIPYRTGSTNTHKALDLLYKDGFKRENGGRRNVPKIAIVITDGESRMPALTKSLAEKAQTAGIHMFSIGVGPEINKNELDAMASIPTSLYSFSVKNFGALSSIEKSLAERTCSASNPGFA